MPPSMGLTNLSKCDQNGSKPHAKYLQEHTLKSHPLFLAECCRLGCRHDRLTFIAPEKCPFLFYGHKCLHDRASRLPPHMLYAPCPLICPDQRAFFVSISHFGSTGHNQWDGDSPSTRSTLTFLRRFLRKNYLCF